MLLHSKEADLRCKKSWTEREKGITVGLLNKEQKAHYTFESSLSFP